MTKTSLQQFISYSDYDTPTNFKKLAFIYSTIQKNAISQRKPASDLKILEVACGVGNITVPLASLGCAVRVFDIDEKSVKILKQKLTAKRFTNVVASVDDANTFDDGNIYDLVVASEMLEHVSNPISIVENISKRLSTNGCFIVTVPNGFGPWEIRNRLLINRLIHSNLIRRLVGAPPYVQILGAEHIQFYKKAQIHKMLSKYSLDLVEFRNSNVFAGVFSVALLSTTIKPSKTIEEIDLYIADRLPSWCASGWYMAFTKH